MPYFNTKKFFLFSSFDLEEKEEQKIDKFLSFLDDSSVGIVIDRYIKNNTSSGGRPGYNYFRLFATILYGFAFNRLTLRELSDACKYDLRYIYLMEQERPSYTTFCEFINKVIVPNEEEIFSLINKEICIKTNTDFNDAFIDGTKYEANSNKYKFVWKPIRYHKNISIKISNIIKKYNLIKNYSDEILIKSSTVAYALTHLNKNKKVFDESTYKKVNKALLAMLEKVLEYEEKETICGNERKSYYKTDKDATAMALKVDYYSGLGSNLHAAYNVQHLVCYGFIFSYHISKFRSDIDDFINVIDRFYRLYDCYPKNICADAGYGSLQNYRYLASHNINNYVKHQSWEGNRSGRNPDCYHLNDDETITCLDGRVGYEVKLDYRHPKRKEGVFYKIEGCNSCHWMPFCKKFMNRQDEDFKIFEVVKDLERYKYQAQDNLCSLKGIELRVNRSIQVEGSFGIIKQDKGYTRIKRRGIEKVSTEIMLISLGFNVAKLFKYFETGKIISKWKLTEDIQPEIFKKPNLKRLIKKGKKINLKIKEGLYSKK